MTDSKTREALDPPEILITEIGGNCPVQAEGTIDGKPFYFRARGGHWSMSIGGDDVIGSPEWYFDAPYKDPNPSDIDIYDKQPQDGGVVVGKEQFEFSAGWMPVEAAESFIHTAAVLYANTRTLSDSGAATVEKIMEIIKANPEVDEAAQEIIDHLFPIKAVTKSLGEGIEELLAKIPEGWEWHLSGGNQGERETDCGFYMFDPTAEDTLHGTKYGNADTPTEAIRAALWKMGK